MEPSMSPASFHVHFADGNRPVLLRGKRLFADGQSAPRRWRPRLEAAFLQRAHLCRRHDEFGLLPGGTELLRDSCRRSSAILDLAVLAGPDEHGDGALDDPRVLAI